MISENETADKARYKFSLLQKNKAEITELLSKKISEKVIKPDFVWEIISKWSESLEETSEILTSIDQLSIESKKKPIVWPKSPKSTPAK